MEKIRTCINYDLPLGCRSSHLGVCPHLDFKVIWSGDPGDSDCLPLKDTLCCRLDPDHPLSISVGKNIISADLTKAIRLRYQH